MTIFLQDLLEKPDIFADLLREHCAVCKVDLQETLTGKRKSPEGDTCSDCYYEKLGDELEKHPLGAAGVRR